MRVALIGTVYVVLCFSMAVGIVFSNAPLRYYYVQWADHWDTGERLCQCTGC